MAALVAHRNYLTDVLQRQSARRANVDPRGGYAPQPELSWRPQPESGPSATAKSRAAPQPQRDDDEQGHDEQVKSKANVVNYVPAQEALRNDYAAWYGVSGQFPSNFVLGAGDEEICEEFPALRRLMDLKADQADATAHEPLHAPLYSESPAVLTAAMAGHRFDVIVIHPPRSWAETAALPIRQLSADPGFVFLWVGSGDAGGLERGRECLAKWGFRRAEDIVWVKTNRKGASAHGGGLFASQKEHCLMGIRGTVRRSTDSRFVHCNVDTDVIVWEPEEGGPRTPPYLYTLVENFCLSARRLELFGDAPPRRGWVSARMGTMDCAQFDPTTYASLLPSREDGKPVVPFHAEIDALRPKSPQRRGARAGGGRPSHAGTPPPAHSSTPSFRPNPGVIRLGSLTPAQHPHSGMAAPMAAPMAHPQMVPGMQGMQGMQGMPSNMPVQVQGMQGMVPMQYQGMGVPGMMPMGMMPMGMAGYGGMPGMGMNQGMMAMHGNMAMSGMGSMGNLNMGNMGMVGMAPRMVPGVGMMSMAGMSPLGSPQTGGAMLNEDDWQHGQHGQHAQHSQHAQAQVQGHPHVHTHAQQQAGPHAAQMNQLAMAMGAMGMPYLGGGGYPYNG